MENNEQFKAAVEQEYAYLRLVHPTSDDTPGCMTLLDTFLSCNVLASQLKSLYRYGHMAHCGQKLDDFKFCISHRALDLEDRREVWLRRRATWWAERRLGKSSEDVWEMRKVPLENYPVPLQRQQLDANTSSSTIS